MAKKKTDLKREIRKFRTIVRKASVQLDQVTDLAVLLESTGSEEFAFLEDAVSTRLDATALYAILEEIEPLLKELS